MHCQTLHSCVSDRTFELLGTIVVVLQLQTIVHSNWSWRPSGVRDPWPWPWPKTRKLHHVKLNKVHPQITTSLSKEAAFWCWSLSQDLQRMSLHLCLGLQLVRDVALSWSWYMPVIHSGFMGAKSDILVYLGSLPHDEVILVQKTLCKDFKSKARKMLQNLKSNILDMDLPSPCLTCSKPRQADVMCAFKCMGHS